MSSLWQRLDDASAAAFRAQMGGGSAYSTLRLDDVQVNEVWEPHKPPWPRMILYSTTARLSMTEHGGGGRVRYGLSYPYLGVAIAAAETYDEARDAAQELFSRMVLVMTQPGPILQTAMAADPSGTELAVRVVPESRGASGIEVTGQLKTWRGVAILGWAVETKV